MLQYKNGKIPENYDENIKYIVFCMKLSKILDAFWD